MPTVTFEDGTKVRFDSTPTAKDIEEAAKNLGVKPKQAPVIKNGGVVKFAKDVAKEVASPFARYAANVVKAGQAAQNVGTLLKEGPSGDWRGKLKDVDASPVNIPLYGEAKPVGMEGSFGKRLTDSLGTGIEAASVVVPAMKAPAFLNAARVGKYGSAIATGATAGGQGGALFGFGRGLQEDKGLGGAATDALVYGGLGALGGAAFGGAIGLPGAVYRGVSQRSNVAANIMTRNARIPQSQQSRFANMADESVGSYLTRRGIYGNKEQIAEQLVQRWQESKSVADAALEALDRNSVSPLRFKPAPVQDALEEMLKRELASSAPNSPSRNLARVQELYKKYNGDGLSMTEINEVKRLFERTVKLDYVKQNIPTSVQKANSIDNAIRGWQFNQAEAMGLTNLKEINKETQLAKQLADDLGRQIDKEGGNRSITLTDWIILAEGDPTAVAAFVAKKFAERGTVQSSLARSLAGKPTVPKPSAMVREPLPHPLLGGGSTRLPGPAGQSSVKAVEAAKTFGTDPKTGQFKRVYTSEPATSGSGTQPRTLPQQTTKPTTYNNSKPLSQALGNNDIVDNVITNPTVRDDFANFPRSTAKGRNISSEAKAIYNEIGDAVKGDAEVTAMNVIKQYLGKIPGRSTVSRGEVATAIDAINRSRGKLNRILPTMDSTLDRMVYGAEGKAKRVGTTGKYVGSPGLHTPQAVSALQKRIEKLAVQGAPGKDWYRSSGQMIVNAFGKEDGKKFAQLLAIYSPATDVVPNYGAALKAWGQYSAGKPIKAGRFGDMDKRAAELLFDGKEWSGIKTNSFYQNMLKYLDPADKAAKDAVTVDMWMARAFGYKTDKVSAQQYEFVANSIRKIAKKLGWTPEQAQAAIWIAAKANKDGFDVKNLMLGGFADAAKKNLAQLSWEAAPSKTSGLFPELHNAPWKQKMEYHAAMEQVFYDSKGRNLVFDLLGIPQEKALKAPGVFEGQVSPGTQFVVQVPRKHLTKENQIEPSFKELLDKASAIMGKYSVQDAVAYHRPFFVNKKFTSGTQINLGRQLTEKEAVALDAAITRRAGSNEFAPISSPDGFRIINFGDMDNKRLHAIIEDAVNEVFPGDVAVRLQKFETDGNYISNDWTNNYHGQDYDRIIAEGTPDLLRRSDLLFKERAESVITEFREKYGWTDNRRGGPGEGTGAEVGNTPRGGEPSGSILPGLPETLPNKAALPRGNGGDVARLSEGGPSVNQGSVEGVQRPGVKRADVTRLRADLKKISATHYAAKLGSQISDVLPTKDSRIATNASVNAARAAIARVRKVVPDFAKTWENDYVSYLKALPEEIHQHIIGLEVVPHSHIRNTAGAFSIDGNGKYRLMINPFSAEQPLYSSGRFLYHEQFGHGTYNLLTKEQRDVVNEVIKTEILPNQKLMDDLFDDTKKFVSNNQPAKTYLDDYAAAHYEQGYNNLVRLLYAHGHKNTAVLQWARKILSELGYTSKTRDWNRLLNMQDDIRKWAIDNGYGDFSALGREKLTISEAYFNSNNNNYSLLNELFARVVEESLATNRSYTTGFSDIIAAISRRDPEELSKLLTKHELSK